MYTKKQTLREFAFFMNSFLNIFKSHEKEGFMIKKRKMKEECLNKVTGGVGSSQAPVVEESEQKGMGMRANTRIVRERIRELSGRKPRRR